MNNDFLFTREDLQVEKEQLIDEGRDITSISEELDELMNLDVAAEPALQDRVCQLMDKAQELPLKENYPYREPSDLEGIRKERPQGVRHYDFEINDQVLYDKVLGAWLGRCSGCLLGKPVEGWRSPRMWGYLKDLNRYPLKDYFISDVPQEIAEKYNINERRSFIDQVDHMPEDDDTNYTVTGLAIIKRSGMDFTPRDVANFWLGSIPVFHTYTAERIAYRNFCMSVFPPRSASFRNPNREWIGAQIRADFFGYVAMGHPELAAELAWRDSSISHVKNGIYGEMWVAAMLAAAAVENDIKKIIQTGLSEIPAKSRLSEAIHEVMGWYDQGVDFEDAISRIHSRWDENKGHHWCHTISNAQIVALGLLWGEYDFEKSICRAVQACFDTDCNGATVGSIVGMVLGAKNLPEKWIKPLNNTLDTGIAGYNRVKIDEVAKEGYEMFKKAIKDL